MRRILLADDSPHAQRMGERILRDEGYEVITVSDGRTALARLEQARPDMILADATLAGATGIEICDFVKSSDAHRDLPVVLTVGALELLDEAEMQRARADAVLRKPFEPTALLDVVSRFAGQPAARVVDRTGAIESATRTPRAVVVLDPAQIRAAVTVALDEEMEPLIERLTTKIVAALTARR